MNQQPHIGVPNTVAPGETIEVQVFGSGLGNEKNLQVVVSCNEGEDQTVEVVDGVATIGPFNEGIACLVMLERNGRVIDTASFHVVAQ